MPSKLRNLWEHPTTRIFTTLTAGLGLIFCGYQCGKNDYKPRYMANINANQEGPRIISVTGKKLPDSGAVFVEQENGSFITWEEDIKRKKRTKIEIILNKP